MVPGALVSASSPASSTTQIKQSWFHSSASANVIKPNRQT
jgi:hypothetical protein